MKNPTQYKSFAFMVDASEGVEYVSIDDLLDCIIHLAAYLLPAPVTDDGMDFDSTQIDPTTAAMTDEGIKVMRVMVDELNRRVVNLLLAEGIPTTSRGKTN